MAEITIETLDGLKQISPKEWDGCAAPGDGRANNPFVTWRFLHALEQSGSVGPGTGWQPIHLVARREGAVIGVAPLYVKGHSQGEYVFDFAWADAWERAGGRYYPKLQMAVPFTPVTGPRLLSHPDEGPEVARAMLSGMVQLAKANQLSSAHITFCTEAEQELGQKMGLLGREGVQFHWVNEGYNDFNAFLAALSARKRKAIRKERTRAQGFGGTIRQLSGDALKPAHWDAFWRFYQDTGQRKWGQPYLTRAFFDLLQEEMRDDVLLVLAERDGKPVAGALNLIGRERIFGRYWGCVEHYDAMHFELCYYQAMDFAIEQGLRYVEAGAQGEHKLARGYLPVATRSLHWIGHDGFRAAVSQFLDAERQAITEEAEILTSFGPFKSTPIEEKD